MTKARTLADNFAADINAITAGTGITGGGTSGTVTVTNSMATEIDAKGDLVVGTGADTFARLAVSDNGSTLVADSSTATGLRYTGNFAAGKNNILNGDINIWQRGTSFTATGYGPDRFYCFRNGGGATYSRQTTSDTTNLPYIQYALRIQRDSGDSSTNNIAVGQSLENASSTPLIGQTVTLSFWGRKGADAQSGITGSIFSGTGTNQNELGTFTGRTTVAAVGAALTSTWTRYSVTGTVPTSATQVALRFTRSSMTGTAGADDWAEITGIQLEIGSVATAFQTATGTLAGELAACQRYYYRNLIGASGQAYGSGFADSTTGAHIFVPFPVQMRVRPTALEQTGTAADYQIRRQGAGITACSAVPQFISGSAIGSQVVLIVASGLTAGEGLMGRSASSDSYLGWSAEL